MSEWASNWIWYVSITLLESLHILNYCFSVLKIVYGHLFKVSSALPRTQGKIGTSLPSTFCFHMVLRYLKHFCRQSVCMKGRTLLPCEKFFSDEREPARFVPIIHGFVRDVFKTGHVSHFKHEYSLQDAQFLKKDKKITIFKSYLIQDGALEKDLQ